MGWAPCGILPSHGPHIHRCGRWRTAVAPLHGPRRRLACRCTSRRRAAIESTRTAMSGRVARRKPRAAPHHRRPTSGVRLRSAIPGWPGRLGGLGVSSEHLQEAITATREALLRGREASGARVPLQETQARMAARICNARACAAHAQLPWRSSLSLCSGAAATPQGSSPCVRKGHTPATRLSTARAAAFVSSALPALCPWPGPLSSIAVDD